MPAAVVGNNRSAISLRRGVPTAPSRSSRPARRRWRSAVVLRRESATRPPAVRRSSPARRRFWSA